MVRMTSLPDALARRVHTNGTAAARLAPATKRRRDILLERICARSFMTWPPAPGGNPARSTCRTVASSGSWMGRTRNTRPFRVSSGAARVDPVQEALPVNDQRHDGEPPGVQRNGHEGHLGPAHLRGRGAKRAVGEKLPHEGGHGHPAAVVAEADEDARLRLVHVRKVIGGEGDSTAPAMLPLWRADLRKEALGRRLETGEQGGIAVVVERPAPAHEETAVGIEPEVEQDAAEIGYWVAARQDLPSH